MEKSFIINRIFNTSADDLFKDFSSADKMAKWFILNDFWTAQVHRDFREGGSFEIEVLSDQGNSFVHDGTYQKIIENQLIEFTWGDGEVENTLVKINFIPRAKVKAQLSLIHSEFSTEEALLHHQGQWNEYLNHLENFVNNPSPFPIYADPDFKHSA